MFCVIDHILYWKDPGGMLLNCLLDDEVQKTIEEFHKGDYGRHLFWKSTVNKILRVGFDWPTFFAYVYKKFSNCHECQFFEGKKKWLPLPLSPIVVGTPFQQWGLDFIAEIHPTSYGKHKWILLETNYFKKWIEAVPTRQATNVVIIHFLESNILSRFGCPQKIIIDNVVALKSRKMVHFCHKYNITIGHSTTYSPKVMVWLSLPTKVWSI